MSIDLAVDGGQSGLRMAVVERLGGLPRIGVTAEVPGFCWGTGVDPERAQAEAMEAAWRQLGSPAPVGTVACGLAGNPSRPAATRRLGNEVAARIGADRVIIADDGSTTHAGALAGSPGTVLAAGTGVACTAVDAAGHRLQVDGWGYLFGDAGGGSWLGQRGLRAALAASEGRAAPTRLTELAVARFGDLRAFVHRVLAAPTLVAEVASFAREVLAAAAAGDEAAASICARAADRLATTAAVTVHRGFPAATASSVPFTWTGSILCATDAIRTPFLTLVAERCPEVKPQRPQGTALDGAALLAAATGTAHHALAIEIRAETGTQPGSVAR